MSEHYKIIDACEDALAIFSYFTLFNIDRLTDGVLVRWEQFAVDSYRYKWGDNLLAILESIREHINQDSCSCPCDPEFREWCLKYWETSVKFVEQEFAITPYQRAIYSNRFPEDSEAVLLAKDSLVKTMATVGALATNIAGWLEQASQGHQNETVRIPPLILTLFCETEDYALKFLEQTKGCKCADIVRTLVSWGKNEYRENHPECCKSIDYMTKNHYGWQSLFIDWLKGNGYNIGLRNFNRYLTNKGT